MFNTEYISFVFVLVQPNVYPHNVLPPSIHHLKLLINHIIIKSVQKENFDN